MFALSTLLISLGLLGNKLALAAPPTAVLDRRTVTAVSAADLAGFAPYTQFARAAYCSTSKLQGWGCGGGLILITASTLVFS